MGGLEEKTVHALDSTFMTMWEYFGEVVKCSSSMLSQNCQLISEEMQNTNKPALFARSMPYCGAGFKEAAAPAAACNIPAALVLPNKEAKPAAYGGHIQT